MMTHQPARADLGPSAPRRRGERIVEAGLGKHAEGRRAVAYWLPAQMHSKGTLSDSAMAAALSFRDDWELSQGARDGVAAQVPSVRADGFSGACPTQTALDAMARVRGALQAAGISGSVCLSMCVARNADLATLAAKLGHREQAAAGYFACVLDRLADHYSGGKR